MLRVIIAGALCFALGFMLSCSGDDDPVKPTPLSVNDYMASLPAWDEFSPLLASSDTETGPAQAEIEWYDNQIYVCQRTPCSMTETPDAISTLNPNSEILYLGSLIQGKTYIGGLGSMEELPIRQRAPLTMSIDLLFDDNTRTVQDPTLATVNQAVGELISGAHNAGHQAGSALSFEKKTYHSLEQGMLKMGFSVSYLGASVRSQLEMNRTVEETSVTAYFRQRMFTTSVVLPQTPGEFFSADFTEGKLNEQIALGRIGPDNLPAYVSNIVWGRILVMTMTSTYSEQEMKAALQASYDGIVSASGTVEAQHLNVLNQSTINIVAVGGEASNALALIRSGNLDDYFASDAALTSAAPISYTLRNLADNTIAQVSETTAYDIIECSPDAVAFFGDYDLWRNAILLTPNGTVEEQLIGPTEIVDANEVTTVPPNNGGVGSLLTFEGANTGLPLDFHVNSWAMTYNDNEYGSGSYPLLSPGDVDNGENDDFEIKVLRVDPGCKVFAIATYVGDNKRESGENLRVYGENDMLLTEFTAEVPHYGTGFMGVLSAVPITRIFFDEAASGDDIFIKNFYFGVDCP